MNNEPNRVLVIQKFLPLLPNAYLITNQKKVQHRIDVHNAQDLNNLQYKKTLKHVLEFQNQFSNIS
jgi:hypothetical protein